MPTTVPPLPPVGFELVAHRGDQTNAPENTLAAFELACQLECEALELDVRLTRDNQLVVIHDPTLDRTTSGNGPVKDFALAELQSLDAGSWFDARFSDQRLPTLTEALDVIGDRRRVVVELKDPPRESTVAEEAVLEALRQGGLLHSALVCSFDWGSMAKVQRLTSEVAVSLIGADAAATLKAAAELDTQHISLLHTACTKEVVAEAKLRGLWINAWTINDQREMRRVQSLGVDSIACDRPADMARWRRDLEEHGDPQTR